MFRNVVRFRRRHRCACGTALILIGLLLILICVPFWVIMALIGFIIAGFGVTCLLWR